MLVLNGITTSSFVFLIENGLMEKVKEFLVKKGCNLNSRTSQTKTYSECNITLESE